MRVKVTRNFQITIPAEIRSKLDIREGDYVDITLNEKEGVIIIRPYRRRWTTLKLGRNLTPDEIEELIRETGNEVIDEMIGDVNNEAAGGC
jgi:AbrB family looped-hinge helix DNA binding protein